MNLLKLSVVTGALTAALIACQQSAPPAADPAVKPSEIMSLDVRSGTTTLASGGTVELAAQVSGSGTISWAIAEGGGSLSNASGLSTTYTAPSLKAGAAPISVTITASIEGGGSSSVRLQVTAAGVTVTPSPPPAANPTGVEIVRITDVRGQPLPLEREQNVSKVVDLFAAQYEDAACLTVRVNDANRRPVPNALVRVTSPTLVDATVAVAPGCVAGSAGAMMAQSTTDPVAADAQGMARFTIFAPSSGLLGDVARLLDGPMKFVVTAGAAGSQVAVEPLEFKVFYLNMSHLYYADGPGFASQLPTGQRVGAVLQGARFSNIFQTRAQPGTTLAQRNYHTFRTNAYQKQPQAGPFAVGAAPATVAPGFMEYSLSDVSQVRDVNGFNVNAVAFAAGCDTFTMGGRTFTSTGDVCYDRDGSGVSISPVALVSDMTLPAQATVNATFVNVRQYGQTTYFFELKSFSFTKTWIGSFATIAKAVDHNVLSWAGPDKRTGPGMPNEPEDLKTLRPTNAPAVVNATSGGAPSDVFTAIATITVRNAGASPIHNLTVRDALPAELGIITEADGVAVNMGGFRGTYDAVNHVLTWNRSNNMSLASLAPGASISIPFRVYARQKPGYCWTGGGTTDYDVMPMQPTDLQGCAYGDPYRVVNGRAQDDVTVSYFFSGDLNDATNVANQQVRDFTPDQNEADINVVRPLYRVEKTPFATPAVILKGAAAFFDLTVRQDDRTLPGREYAALRQRYPNEFVGGTGRKNPFGTGLRLSDRMGRGLDFTDAQALNVAPGLAGAASYPAVFPVGGDTKHVRFDIPLTQVFQANDVGTTRLTLNANLASVGAGGVPLNGALRGYWYNCAYLEANNLNQQTLDPNVYGSYPLGLRPPWGRQVEGAQVVSWNELPATDLPTNPFLAPTANWIQTCARVGVVADQRFPIVGLSGRHEFTNAGPALEGPTDPYRVGQTFAYKYDSLNVGSTAALNAVMRVQLPSTSVAILAGTPVVYRSTDRGATFAATSIGFTITTNAVVQTEAFDMAPGVIYRLVAPARAVGAGREDNVLGTLSVPGQPVLTALDDTTVTP